MPDMSFPESVIHVLATDSYLPAVEHGERTVTRGELLALAGRIAGGLRAGGLGPGSGLGMRLEASPESLAAYLAAYATGCRVVAIRPGLGEDQERQALGDDVAVVLTDAVVAELARGRDAPLTV